MTQLTKKSATPPPATQAKDPDTSILADMPITEHLIELRRHLIHCFVAVLVVFLALVGFSRDIYDIFSIINFY